MFSVIIPCYNCGPWIGRALRSVARQSCSPREIIVIDDGSTDDSLKQVRDSGVDVRLLRGEHAGAAAARNRGIEEATGDWIAFLDADDYWYADHLEQAARLIRRGDDVAVTGMIDLFRKDDPDDVRRPANEWTLLEPSTGLADVEYIRCCLRKPRLSFISTLVLRSRLEEVGGFDAAQERRHDVEMWLRLIQGHTWAFNPAYTAAHQDDTPGSISQNRLSCEGYVLRAYLRNRDRFPFPEMTELVQRQARRVASCALTDGDGTDREEAMELARPHLSPGDRRLFGCFGAMPGAYRGLNRIRRWLLRPRFRSRVSKDER
jgi:hypothetical protein